MFDDDEHFTFSTFPNISSLSFTSERPLISAGMLGVGGLFSLSLTSLPWCMAHWSRRPPIQIDTSTGLKSKAHFGESKAHIPNTRFSIC